MVTRKKFFLHVGYPKTATTTLQKMLFKRHPDLCYLGKPLAGDLLELERQIVKLDSVQFERVLPRLQDTFAALVARQENGRNMMLSHEDFLRPARYGGHDIGRTAERIRQVFADPVSADYDVCVMLIIRRQVDIIPSYFFDSVSRIPNDFRRFVEASLEHPRQGYFATLFYNEVAAYYKRLFGKDRVTLFTFEDFVSERDGFAQRLSGYLGIDADRSQQFITSGSFNTKARSSSGSGYHITANEYLLDRLHRHNWKIASFPRWLRIVLKRAPLSNLSFELDSRQRSSIVSLYSESNRLLAEDFDIELGKLGYY
jgi:hypothetical protein